jgi:arylsulfatase A-like enzyme
VPLIVRWPEKIEAGQVSGILLSGEDVLPTLIDAAGMQPEAEVTGKSFLPALMDQPYTPHEYIFAQRGPHSSGLPLHTGYFDLIRTVFNNEYKLIYNITWQLPYEPIDFRSREPWTTLTAMHENGQLSEPFDRIFFSVPRPMFELYDLKKDPYEMNNLIEDPDYESVVQELKARLHEWMIVNQDYAPLPIPPPRRR